MALGEILDIIIIALLAGMLLLQITGQRKTDLSKITALLKRTSEDQRDSVQKQIASGATEQFERFGVIQKSIQDTLLANRTEINQQLYAFQRQVEAKLTAIQKANTESNEQIGRTLTIALQTSREEQNSQLHAFSRRLDGRLSSIQQ